uniref:Amino acid transporter transmembrane domain-containing protein n=1 Tax=Araucaria cunninghamii TaxID=56994 RepID=A0A0D6QTA5_ARACU
MTIGTLVAAEEENDGVPLLPEKQQDAEAYGKNNASFLGGVVNLSTTIVGAGIMALPATMKILGLVLGLSLLVLVGLLTYVSVEFLLRFGRAGNATSYGDVMADAFGRPGRVLSQVCVVVKTLGILIIYMIIIGDVVSGTSSNGIHHIGLLEEWFGVCWWTGRTAAMFLTTVLILVPLVSFRRVDSLRFTSALSVSLAVVFVVITAGITIVKLFRGHIYMPRLLPDVMDQASFWRLFTVVPVMVTAYICHYNVHPIQNELAKPSEMKNVVQTSLALSSTIYIATSFFGYLLFGDEIMSDVLANFDKDLGVPYSSVLNDIVRISYALHLMLVFPVVHFALRLNLDGLVFPAAHPLALDSKRFAFITTGLLSFVFLGATFIPSIWDAFQVTGATVAVCIGFIFPGSVALRDAHGTSTRKDKILALIIIIMAAICSLIAVSSDMYELFTKLMPFQNRDSIES